MVLRYEERIFCEQYVGDAHSSKEICISIEGDSSEISPSLIIDQTEIVCGTFLRLPLMTVYHAKITGRAVT